MKSIALFALFNSLASATVFLGLHTANDGSQEQVAWTNGTPDPCSGFTIVVSGNNNPCGRDFFVDGGNGPFTFNGCGGNGLELDRNHQFNSNCAFGKVGNINCPTAKITGIWQCN